MDGRRLLDQLRRGDRAEVGRADGISATQRDVDGVFEPDRTLPTVLEELVSQRRVANVFALCMCGRRGTLTLGPPRSDPRRATSWTAAKGDSFYGVQLQRIQLGATALAPKEPPAATIVDSGTTFMYFNTTLKLLQMMKTVLLVKIIWLTCQVNLYIKQLKKF